VLILTIHRLIMTNKKTCHKFRCLHDLFTLIVFLILLSIVTNTIFEVATSIDKGTYSTSIADLKFPLHK